MKAEGARRFKPYPAYKDSGVEWLGEIPEHWEVKRLKRLASLRAGSAITAESIDETGDYPVYGGNGIRGYSSSYTHEGEFPLIGRQGALCGCVNFASGRFWTSEHAVVATPQPDVNCHWLTYLLRATSLNSYSQSAAQPGLAVESISVIPLPMPPVPEQRVVAAFLDQETARIDALVAKKERLIALLLEQRTAIITHAVTKGLPSTGSGQATSNAPMKDSGVEWLGEIPVHWQERRLGQLLKHRPRNGVSPPIGPYGATPTFSTAAVKDGVVAIDGNIKYTTIGTLEAEPFRVSKGDVLLLRGSGSRALVGRAGIVTSEPPEGCVYPDILIRVRPRIALTPWFLVNSLNSSAVRHQIELAAKTAAGIWKITGDDVQCLVIAVPPVPEQLQIEKWASDAMTTIDALVAKVRDAIDRLEELRIALISAAVTGKIDVRTEAA